MQPGRSINQTREGEEELTERLGISAVIDDETFLGHGCRVTDGSMIRHGCWMGPGVRLGEGRRIVPEQAIVGTEAAPSIVRA
jgi:acetyltransferase-like isoleucine patch superfamily enzyme